MSLNRVEGPDWHGGILAAFVPLLLDCWYCLRKADAFRVTAERREA
jgi:hypothetical protein